LKTALTEKLMGSTRSKTMFVGFLVIFFGYVYDNSEVLRSVIPPSWFGPTVMVVGAVFMALRWVTKYGLEEK